MTRKQRKQTRRDDTELRAASGYLCYEYCMFNRLAAGLASGITGKGVLHSALLESFIIHARILLDFLYRPRNLRDDDVIAEDFFKDHPETWCDARPPKSEILGAIHDRAGKEIAHLSYKRQEVTPEEKQWPVIEIKNDIGGVFEKFRSLVPEELLGERWNKYKP